MSLLPNASYAGTTENFWQPATGTINITGGLNVSGLIQAGLLNVAGLADVGALTTTGAVTSGSVATGSISASGALSASSITTPGAVTASGAVSGNSLSSSTTLAVTGATTTGSLVVATSTQLVPAPPGAGTAVTWATAVERKGTKLIYTYSATLSSVQNIGVPYPYAGNVFNQAGVLTINLQSQGTAGDANGRIIQVQYAIYNVGSSAFTQSANYVNDITGGVTGSAPAGYVLTAGGASYSGSCFVTWETIQP